MTRLEFINFIKSTKLIYATVSYNEFNEHMDVFEGRQELSPFTKDLEEVLIFKNNRGNIKITIQHRSVLKKNDLNTIEIAKGFENSCILFLSNKLNQESFKENREPRRRAKSAESGGCESLAGRFHAYFRGPFPGAF